MPLFPLLIALCFGAVQLESVHAAAAERSALDRIDCHPEPGANATKCAQRRCTWDDTQKNVVGIPSCFYVDTTGYILGSDGTSLTPAPNNYNPYYTSMAIKLRTTEIGSILNVKFFADGRYEPLVEFPRVGEQSSERFTFKSDTSAPGSTFAFTVTRASDGTNIWDTSIGGLLFGDQYIQIATYLPTKNIYGFGDHIHKTLRHNMERYTNWPIFTRDAVPDSYSNLSTTNIYGAHPFYMALESSGKAHGVLILNSNAQEVVLGPAPHLVYRTIGGNIDLYFFPGPNPEDVARQYHQFIGRPFMPAYWGFGYQLSRWGYPSYDDMVAAVTRTRNAGVPLEMVVADIDHMERFKIFTLSWTKLPEYVSELHKHGIRLTIIIDPGIQVNYATFERAMNMGARFVEWPSKNDVQAVNNIYPLTRNTTIMLGNVWPDNNTAMPDFMDPTGKTENWWINEFRLFHERLSFDNIWIDMNEPSNFDTDPITNAKVVDPQYRLRCPVQQPAAKYDNPNYLTWAAYGFGENSYLFTKTECLMGKVAAGNHILYNTHSLYGMWMAKRTQQAQEQVLKTRGAMISRSTYPSSGHYTGHWLGDNTAHWEDLQTSVIGVMESNLFGMTFSGSDICGFFQDTTEELCLRWHQMGAFHPFSRNHNAENYIPQDPAQWPSVVAAAKQALLFKYTYLPFMYTLFYQSSINGGTVIRPVFFEFPTDSSTYDINYQFMWGSAMMVIPVVFPGKTTIDAYVPPTATWYSLREDDYGTELPKQPTMKTFSVKTNELIPVLVRGGVILTRQAPANVLRDARNNPFDLLITLEFDKNNIAQPATGELFWDDGESLLTQTNFYYFTMTFTISSDTATLSINRQYAASSVNLPTLDFIEIFGYPWDSSNLNSVVINNTPVNIISRYNATTKVLRMEAHRLIDWKNSNLIQLSWKRSSIIVTTQQSTTTTSASSKNSIIAVIIATAIQCFLAFH